MTVKPTFSMILRESVPAERNIIRMLKAYPRMQHTSVIRSRMALGFMIMERELQSHSALDDYRRILACVKTGLGRKSGCAEGIMTYLRVRALQQEETIPASTSEASAAIAPHQHMAPDTSSITSFPSGLAAIQPFQPSVPVQALTPAPTAASSPTPSPSGATAFVQQQSEPVEPPVALQHEPHPNVQQPLTNTEEDGSAPFDWSSTPFAALAGR